MGQNTVFDEQDLQNKKEARCLIRFFLWAEDQAINVLDDRIVAEHAKGAIQRIQVRFDIDDFEMFNLQSEQQPN